MKLKRFRIGKKQDPKTPRKPKETAEQARKINPAKHPIRTTVKNVWKRFFESEKDADESDSEEKEPEFVSAVSLPPLRRPLVEYDETGKVVFRSKKSH
jgi:hypothetical protein